MKALTLMTLALAPFFSSLTAPTAEATYTEAAVARSSTTVNKTEFDVIGGFEIHEWNLELVGGSTAFISVLGDGDSDLDIYLYDAFGNLVAFDAGPTDSCLVTVLPTGEFTLVIVNLGSSSNLYELNVF